MGGAVTDALIYSAVRTPAGRHGGALADVRPDDLAAVEVLGHFFIGLGKAADFVLGDVNGHTNPAP